MTSRPSPAIRLVGAAALLLTLPSTLAATPAATTSVRVAQAAPPAPQPPASQSPASLTVPVPQAQPGAGPDEARRRDDRQDERRAFVEAGIAALHAGLLLTPAQQGLWPPVETALRDLGATRGGMRAGTRDGMRRDRDGDPVARLKERATRLVARGQAMGRLADAAAPLYAALTPEQKERVPALLHRIMPRRMIGGHGMRGGERGMGDRDMGDRGMRDRGMRDRFRRMDGDRG